MLGTFVRPASSGPSNRSAAWKNTASWSTPSSPARCESLRYRLYTLEKAIDVGRSSRERLEGVRLCVLVDGRDRSTSSSGWSAALVEAGVGMIQLRDKQLDDRELVDRARQLRQLTRGTATLAIVNDRADIAAAVRCRRRASRPGRFVGEGRPGDRRHADARSAFRRTTSSRPGRPCWTGPITWAPGRRFRRRPRRSTSSPGLDYLREVAAEIRLPTFAIGGITADNLPDVLATGISRVAVGAAVTEAADPAVAARELLGMLKSAIARTRSLKRSRRP